MAGDDRPEASSFEKELQNLQRVVDLLERGDLSLEEAIAQYESGFQSLKKCYQVLDDARKRIEILTDSLHSAGGNAAGSGETPPCEHPRGVP